MTQKRTEGSQTALDCAGECRPAQPSLREAKRKHAAKAGFGAKGGFRAESFSSCSPTIFGNSKDFRTKVRRVPKGD